MLGGVLVPALRAAGHDVRVLSRREGPALATGDLTTGEGLREALEGRSVVVHAASSAFRRTKETDVVGTARLLDAAREAGVEHVVFPSIVGVDRHPFRYYRAKWGAEQLVEGSPVPWSIARATQFHGLLDFGLRGLSRSPVIPVARFVFQPVDAAEYAAVLAALVTAGPSGRVPDTGGPEVRPFRSLVRAWLRANGKRRAVVPFPLVGKTARAFRAGVHTCPDRAIGSVTWEDYLARSSSRPRS